MSLKIAKLSDVEPASDWKLGARRGDVEWAVNGDIHLHVYPGDNVYTLESRRVQSDKAMLGWLIHINRKTWGDRVLSDLVELFAVRKGG